MARMKQTRRIVILTGAGISAESGIDTFRSAGGIWERHRVEDVATPQGFARDPELVLRFHDMRRARIQEVEPNAAHHALARLDALWPRDDGHDLLIVTQNVDDLHERAGAQPPASTLGEGEQPPAVTLGEGRQPPAVTLGEGRQRLVHMHGQHLSAWCVACDARQGWRGPLIDRPPCGACGEAALRPDIVWFGETPYRMREIYDAVERCDLFVSIGTSGAVYPAGGLVRRARAAGAATLELNLEPSKGSALFDVSRLGPATRLVPEWVEEVLGRRI